MRIRVVSQNHNINLVLPTRLIFSPGLVRFGLKIAKRFAPKEMENIPIESAVVICRELIKIKKKYGRYELVEVHSADGEHVSIIL